MCQLNNVFDLVFSRQYYHSQIAQRSSELLNLYASEKALTETEVGYLWEASQNGGSMKVEVYKLLKEAGYRIPANVMKMFMQRLIQMPPESMGERDLEFHKLLVVRRRAILGLRRRQRQVYVLRSRAVQQRHRSQVHGL